MQLDLVRHLWGVSGPLPPHLRQFSELGYAAIEAPAPAADALPAFKKMLDESKLGFIPMVFTHGATVQEHVRALEAELERVTPLSPRFINAHSGRDSWSLNEARQFFEAALELEARSGIAIAHETHRGRVFFNPWVTRDLLTSLPELKLTCDYSHWVCVAERLLDTEFEILELCARHAYHIHARVGHEQGPQVADPRAPEYHRHLDAHERYWDMIWDSQQKRGFSVTTLTPEYGPPAYMPTLPFTQAPVTDLAAICEWQAQRSLSRFKQRALASQ